MKQQRILDFLLTAMLVAVANGCGTGDADTGADADTDATRDTDADVDADTTRDTDAEVDADAGTDANDTPTCASDSCLDNQTCIDAASGFRCVCDVGRFGASCELCPEDNPWVGDLPDDVREFEGYTHLAGELTIAGQAELTDLGFLACMRQVDGGVSIYSNDALLNIDGVGQIDSGTDWFIGDNLALADVAGLSHLTSFSGELRIDGNGALVDLTGLSNLTSVGGLAINRNGPLVDLAALSSLTSVDGRLSIGGNEALVDLSGLSNLTSVGGAMNITGNAALGPDRAVKPHFCGWNTEHRRQRSPGGPHWAVKSSLCGNPRS